MPVSYGQYHVVSVVVCPRCAPRPVLHGRRLSQPGWVYYAGVMIAHPFVSALSYWECPAHSATLCASTPASLKPWSFFAHAPTTRSGYAVPAGAGCRGRYRAPVLPARSRALSTDQ